MISVAIISIMASIIPVVMIQIHRFTKMSQARTEIQRDVRNTLEVINRQLRQASAATVVIDKATSQPPLSRITFTTVDGATFKFYQSGRRLLHEPQGKGARVLSSNLRYIAFTYPRTDDTRIISVSITTEKETYGGGAKALQLSIEKVRVMNP